MKILVIRFSSLGDLVTLEIAFRAVRHFYPDAQITMLTSAIGKALYQDSGYFSDFIVLDSNYFTANRMLRHSYYDKIFNLQCNRPSHLLLWGVKSGQLLNQSESWWQKFLYIKVKATWIHELLAASGIDQERVDRYFADPAASQIRLPYTADLPPPLERLAGSRRPIVVIAPGASERWESKKWGDDRYLRLAGELLNAEYGVVLIGSSLERPIGEAIEVAYPSIVNMIAKTTLSQLKALLAAVDLLIGNDSGPAHLAAGVGTNTLTIFGSTDIKHCVQFGGYRGRHAYLVAEPRLRCQPCYKSKCPTGHECMQAISVDEVLTKAQELLCSNG